MDLRSLGKGSQLACKYFPATTTAVFLVFLSCSKKESINVSITTVPTSPVVITAKLTIETDDDGDGITDTTKTVSPPWFPVTFVVSNNTTDQTVTIITYKLDFSGTKDGKTVTGNSELDPGEIGTGVTALHPDVGPGKSSTSGTWYIHSLPEIDSFNYGVKVAPQGWIGSSQNPQDRLQGLDFFISTQ